MRLNQFIFFVSTTVILGSLFGLISVLLGFGVQLPWYLGIVEGAFLATTSLMGFWAYLMLNFIARVTVPFRVWRWAQVLVLLLVIFDMLVERHKLISHALPARSYIFEALWPLVLALLVGIWKRRLSGKGSYVPTVFYLYVFTILDWLLVLKTAQASSMVNQTGLIMFVCNAYMILIFGKLLSPRPAIT
jgi:KinB signaling pathway activation protein